VLESEHDVGFPFRVFKGRKMNTKTDLRPSPIAGQWYSGNPKELAASVDNYINTAKLPEIRGEIIAVVAPHAGHIYSGPVAGYAFAALKGLKPSMVAVISPMHRPYFEPLLTSSHEAYQTPLGSIPVDQEALDQLDGYLKNDIGIQTTPIRNDAEHSLEIQLPFLQQALAVDFSLLPVMVRDTSVRVVMALGKTLARILENRNAIMVASTDLSHFYSQKTANAFDQEMLRRIESFDPESVLNAEDEGKAFACGRGAVAAVLWAAEELGGNHVEILNYATSGDVSGDYSQVVGYGAAVITKS
jgi:AmmeMemoRadiSam system protein B